MEFMADETLSKLVNLKTAIDTIQNETQRLLERWYRRRILSPPLPMDTSR